MIGWVEVIPATAMEFVSEMRCGRLNLFFMPEDSSNPLDDLAKKQHEAAMKVLEFFIDQYMPANNKDDADTFLTTDEISNAIASHTGVRISNAEIFEMLSNMSYKYEAMNGVEFNWLLKREQANDDNYNKCETIVT
jgi:arginine utilization protein RocB